MKGFSVKIDGNVIAHGQLPEDSKEIGLLVKDYRRVCDLPKVASVIKYELENEGSYCNKFFTLVKNTYPIMHKSIVDQTIEGRNGYEAFVKAFISVIYLFYEGGMQASPKDAKALMNADETTFDANIMDMMTGSGNLTLLMKFKKSAQMMLAGPAYQIGRMLLSEAMIILDVLADEVVNLEADNLEALRLFFDMEAPENINDVNSYEANMDKMRTDANKEINEKSI